MIKFLKRFALVVLFCLIGWSIGYLYGIANLNGYLIQWDTIDSPPVAPKEILTINNGVWVKTTNGEIYYYNDTINCRDNCWTKMLSIPDEIENWLSLEKCTIPVQKKSFIAYQGKCESYGPGGFHVVYYGISAKGTIYRWEDFSAEGDEIISIIAPIIGLLLGLVLSVGVVISLYIKDHINLLNQNQQKSSP